MLNWRLKIIEPKIGDYIKFVYKSSKNKNYVGKIKGFGNDSFGEHFIVKLFGNKENAHDCNDFFNENIGLWVYYSGEESEEFIYKKISKLEFLMLTKDI